MIDPKLVTLFGGGGFIGRYVCEQLFDYGEYNVRLRVVSREPRKAHYIQPLAQVGQWGIVRGDVTDPASVRSAVEGASAVINLTGAFKGMGAVHAEGSRTVAEAARAAGASSLVHISAIGADAESEAVYARTKGEGEAAVREIFPNATIIRPSIVFGPEDSFFNKFADMARTFPVLPLVGGGKTKFQPVYVEDVAEAVARAVDGKVETGKIYELGGPEVLTFRECLETMLKVTVRKNRLVSLPFGIASMIGSIASLVPFIAPPITPDQVKLLKHDNVVSKEAEAEGRTLKGLGIAPTMVTSVLDSYLVQYRPHGQYTGSGKAA
jgi:NADH dehydrogenase